MIGQSCGVHPSASNCSTTDSSHCLCLTHIHSLTSTMSMTSHLLYLMKGTLMNFYIICFTACRLRRSVPSKKALHTKSCNKYKGVLFLGSMVHIKWVICSNIVVSFIYHWLLVHIAWWDCVVWSPDGIHQWTSPGLRDVSTTQSLPAN